MRIAVVFPPQWDPRAPPRTPMVLAAAARQAGAEVRVFDLNLALYRKLSRESPAALAQWLDPGTLQDVGAFADACAALERAFNSSYDASPEQQLFWDTLQSPLCADSGRHWGRAMDEPRIVPAVRHLVPEIDALVDWRPDAVALSAISDTQLATCLALVGVLSERLPGARILLGGRAFSYRRGILGRFPWLFARVSAVCVGAGEPVMHALALGADLAAVPGLVTQRGSAPASTGEPEIVAPQDLQPPVVPADFLASGGVIPVETARGCPWGRCAFCVHPPRDAQGRPAWRPRPMPRVEAELRAWIDTGLRRFYFVDEAIAPDRLALLCDVLRGLPPITWICYSRLDAGHGADLFSRMRAAGCRKIFFGLETGSETLLRRFRKGVEPATAVRVLRDAGRAGIAVHLFLMVGFPGESQTDRDATVAAAGEALEAHDPRTFTFDVAGLRVERDTPLFLRPEAFGMAPVDDGSPARDAAYHFAPPAAEAVRDAARSLAARLGALLGTDGPRMQSLHLSQDSLHLPLVEAISR